MNQSSWKTTLLGLAAAGMNLVANGQTPKQVGFSLAIAFLGILAKDHGQK